MNGRVAGVAYLDREVLHIARALGQELEQAQVGRVVALHRPDLEHAPGRVARGGDAVALGERERERLLAEHVQAGLERLAGDLGVERIGRGDDDRIEAEAEQVVERGVLLRDAVALADGGAHGGRRIGDGREVEELGLVPEVVGMHGLADQTRSDQPDPQTCSVMRHAPAKLHGRAR